MPKGPTNLQAIEKIVEKNPRFRPEAYVFVQQSLDFTLRRIVEEKTRNLGDPPHVTGRELLEGVRDLARPRFGRLAPLVFRKWGIERSRDFGEIVFRMVDAKIMSKSRSDSLDDFGNGFEIETAFQDFSPRLAGPELVEGADGVPGE